MTPQQLEEIKARAEAATPGPWEWRGYYLMQPAVDGSGALLGRDDDLWANPFCGPSGSPIADDGSAGGEYSPAIDTNGADADFIAHARQDIPDLIADNERLRAELRERCAYLEKSQFPLRSKADGTLICTQCFANAEEDHDPDCRHARLMQMPEVK